MRHTYVGARQRCTALHRRVNRVESWQATGQRKWKVRIAWQLMVICVLEFR